MLKPCGHSVWLKTTVTTDMWCAGVLLVNLFVTCFQADIIHTREYNEWRHKGVAFSVREATYDAPNRTLASARVFKHVSAFTYYFSNLLIPYTAELFVNIFHSFEAGIANTISCFK